MSVIQVEDLVLYQLRTDYLNNIKDGVGERLITINDAFLNTPGFKAAGWRPNPAQIKRTHSPPIPTAITSEYFRAPPRSAGLRPGGLEDEVEDSGGMVTGGGAENTVGPGLATKRRRRREQIEEEDSSDLSDDSDEESDQRAAQQIKFAKMPVRMRSGSSPIRSSREAVNITSPSRNVGTQPRRGSQSAVEAIKQRTRADTITSSEMSSETDLDASAFQKHELPPRSSSSPGRPPRKLSSDPNSTIRRQESDLLEDEMEDYSDGSDMPSSFAESIESTSILDSVVDSALDGPLHDSATSSPTTHVVGTMPKELIRAPTKKSKPAPPLLPALPPPRPISMIQPKSLLSAAIKAKRAKSAMPFEKFASLSGQGDPNPLALRIWVPFVASIKKHFEVLSRRTVHGGESGGDRAVTVADLIGLSLWRFSEEKLEPQLAAEQLNVNRWTLRMVEDEEVDFDFPALDRTKPISSFTTMNNRAARTRTGSKPYDEFALVEAKDEEFQANQKATPEYQQESVSTETGDDDLKPIQPLPSADSGPVPSRGNPLLNPPTNFRSNSALADMPAAAAAPTQTRSGPKKLLRIHIHSLDAVPGQMITVEVTTDTYLAEVLDIVCKKRQLDKAAHVLKLTGSGTVVLLDRTVESIGARSDLDLFRRRFATDGPLTISGSPSSTSPKTFGQFDLPPPSQSQTRKIRKPQMPAMHPLARSEAVKQDELGSANYRKYTVWRKQPMRFVGMNERIIAIDGEYLHIMPATAGKTMFEGQGKTTTVHFSNVIGCKVTRRHPNSFKLVVYKNSESKRYDFETKSPDEAAEIVYEIKKGIAPYHDV